MSTVRLIGFRTRTIGGKKVTYPVFEPEALAEWREDVAKAELTMGRAKREFAESLEVLQQMPKLWSGRKVPSLPALEKVVKNYIKTGKFSKLPGSRIAKEALSFAKQQYTVLQDAKAALREIVAGKSKIEKLEGLPGRVLLPQQLAEALTKSVNKFFDASIRDAKGEELSPEQAYFYPAFRMLTIRHGRLERIKTLLTGSAAELQPGADDRIESAMEIFKEKDIVGMMFATYGSFDCYKVMQLFSKLPMMMWYRRQEQSGGGVPFFLILNLQGKTLPKSFPADVKAAFDPGLSEIGLAHSLWNRALSLLEKHGYAVYGAYSFNEEFKECYY